MLHYTDKHRRPTRERDLRLRYGLARGVMPLITLHALMEAHRHHPGLQMLTNRFGPANMAGLMDYDIPRRYLCDTRGTASDPIDTMTWDAWSENDRTVKSIITSIPRREITTSLGWKQVLVPLLKVGSLYPGAALDDWLGDLSRRFCKNEFRLHWRNT